MFAGSKKLSLTVTALVVAGELGVVGVVGVVGVGVVTLGLVDSPPPHATARAKAGTTTRRRANRMSWLRRWQLIHRHQSEAQPYGSRECRLPAAAFLSAARVGPSRRLVHILTVFLDALADLASMHSGLRAGICYGAAQSNVVSNDVDTIRFLEQIIDVRLPDPKMSVKVASVVRLVTISHLVLL
jgi:hypothetical protein